MPIISIIVPVYKVEKYLHRCIDSILAQTYTDFELILVDDGSPDRSGSICDAYAQQDARIRVIHKENGGVSTARNAGMKEAKGEWITFIDSDDWVDETYLEDFHVEQIEESKTLVFQGITFNPTHVKKEYPLFKYESSTFNLADQNEFCKHRVARNGCPVAKLFSKEMLLSKNLFFDGRFTINEDHLFITQCLTVANTIVLSNRNNYHYYFEYGAMSLTRRPHHTENLLQLSAAMSDAFMNLCLAHNYEIDRFRGQDTLQIFGMQQILRAVESAVESNSKKMLLLCCGSLNTCELLPYFKADNLGWRFIAYLMQKEQLNLLLVIYRVKTILGKWLRWVKQHIKTILAKF